MLVILFVKISLIELLRCQVVQVYPKLNFELLVDLRSRQCDLSSISILQYNYDDKTSSLQDQSNLYN